MSLYNRKYVLWISILLVLTVLVLLPANLSSERHGLLVESSTSTEGSGVADSREAQLYLLEKETGKVKAHLTSDLFAARSPDLFHDGKQVVFSAKEDQASNWQVFSYDLEDDQYEQLFGFGQDCFDPVFLPNGGVVFSSPLEIAKGTSDLALFRWNPGEQPQGITFTPYSFLKPMIMQDGRILALYADSPESPVRSLMVMRPDGTKNALFYKSPEGNEILGDLLQLDNGHIVFLEKNPEEQTKEIVSVSYNNPLASREVLYSMSDGVELSLGATDQGELLIAKKEQSEDRGSWFVLNPETVALEAIDLDQAKGIYGPAFELRSKDRQRILPSAVKPEEETALLMCQDSRVTGNDLEGSGYAEKGSVEVQGLDQSMGTIDLEADGSFYLKLKADKPFRFQRLDDKGEPLGAPSAWISLRPNERRACIGCHVGNERVPENVQPLAVQKEPQDLSKGEIKIMADKMD